MSSEGKMLVWVSFDFTGYHSYPKAPNDVKYLADKHRHRFYCKVGLYVDPLGDRVIEFHQLQNYLTSYYHNVINTEDTGSCEQIAKNLVKLLHSFNSTRPNPIHPSWLLYEITVSEDKECGVVLTNI